MSDAKPFDDRFREFYDRNYSRLISFASGQATNDYPKEDLLHDAIVKTLKRLESTSCDDTGREWWLMLCGKIVSLRIDRFHKGKESPVDTTEHNTTDEAPLPSKVAEHSDDEQAVREAVAHMDNEPQRRVWELLLDDRTLSEVADAMHISYCHAKQLAKRGRDALRKSPSLRKLAEAMNLPTERPRHEP